MDFTSILEKNWKMIVGVSLVVVVSIGAQMLLAMRSVQKEKVAQESYFLVEKKLTDYKAKKDAPPTAKDKDKNSVDTSAADLQAVKDGFTKVIADYPKSIAAQMAGLHLAALFVEEKKFDQALVILQGVQTDGKGLVNTLVQQQIGQLMADKQNCKEAVSVWQKIIDRKEAEFLHNDVKLQQALCYSQMNDYQKAEEILTNLANTSNPDMGNSSVAKEAEKYLRLIQFKKAGT